MTKTEQITLDNLSLHAIVAGVPCRRITLRELVSDADPVGYDVAAPYATSPVFPKAPGESTVFECGAKENLFQTGEKVGYIQPNAGTIVFSLIYE